MLSLEQIIVRSLPPSVIIEIPENEWNRGGYVLNKDCSVLAINEAGNIYLCQIEDGVAPYMIHELTVTESEYQQEWHSAMRFLDSNRLLVRVSGYEWVVRYEIFDLQGNTLQVLQPNDTVVSAMGYNNFIYAADDALLLATPPVQNDQDVDRIFSYMDYEDFVLRPLDWLNQEPYNALGTRIAVSPDLTRGVLSFSHIGEDLPFIERSEFYLVDFKEETITKLDLEVDKANIDSLSVVGNYLYFSYESEHSRIEGWRGSGIFTLPS